MEDKGGDGVVARMKSNKIISGDVLLYAVGRQGNVDELNLAAAGLEADCRGRIAVDAEYRTKVANIFAATAADFQKATHVIQRSAQYPTHLTLPVLAGP